ncbi:hypothetical protein [Devosia sp. A16]|uniref:hypothetical protein n=1 Tax=Devosia sp. A16 TaxID=1736675 RepID=UPI0006D76B1C|nr:hypothetical protein [Devosia sp. A16]
MSSAPVALDGNIWTLIQFGVITGLATAVFNALFGLLKEWLDRGRLDGRARRQSAQLIVDTLEQYAQACSQMIAMNGHERDQGSVPSMIVLPTLGSYPSNDDWRSFPPRLTRRLHDLRSEIDTANLKSRNTFEVTRDPDEQAQEAEKYAAITGWEGVRISRDIRRRFCLGGRRKLVGRGPDQHLLEKAKAARAYVREG